MQLNKQKNSIKPYKMIELLNTMKVGILPFAIFYIENRSLLYTKIQDVVLNLTVCKLIVFFFTHRY